MKIMYIRGGDKDVLNIYKAKRAAKQVIRNFANSERT